MLIYVMIYVVWYLELMMLKIGCVWVWLWVQWWFDWGWYLIVCQCGMDVLWEWEVLWVLCWIFLVVFIFWVDVEDVFGFGGKGYIECFIVEFEDLNFVFDVCVGGFVRGNEICELMYEVVYDQC